MPRARGGGGAADRPARARQSRAGGAAYWIWGRHAAGAALTNPARRIRRHLALASAEIGAAEIVSRDALERVLPEGAIHQGLAVLAEPLNDAGLDTLCEAARARDRAAVVVLDRVQDPRNVGAILRSAAALGAVGLVVPDRGAPRESGTLAKAASGALETVPIARVANLARALARMKEAGLWCVGFDAAAAAALDSAALPDRAALVFGAEGRGLRRLTAAHCDLLVRIPVSGGIASLNVSAAAAIALHAHAGGAA